MNYWDPAVEQRLWWLYAIERWDWTRLSKEVGHSIRGCQRKVWRIHRCEGDVEEWKRHLHITVLASPCEHTDWHDRHRRILLDARSDNVPFERIAELLGRSVGACKREERRIMHAGAKPLLEELE